MSASQSEPEQTGIIKHDDFKSHESPDLTLETFWYIKRVDPRTDEKTTIKHTLKLLVNKKALNSLPAYDKRKPTAVEVTLSPRWSGSSKTSFTLDDRNDHGIAWKLMLSIFTPTESTALTPEVLASPDINLEIFWHLAVVCDKWNVDAKDERVAATFRAWYAVHKMEEAINSPSKLLFAQSLLWPAWYFDHAKAFQWATRYVIYNDAGHIEPWNPTKYRNIIIPKRITRKYLIIGDHLTC